MVGRRVLITGGAGFIGSHVAEALLASGHEVLVLDDLSSGHRHNLSAAIDVDTPQGRPTSGLALLVGDVRDHALVATCIAHVDAVIHLAAIASVARCEEDPALSDAVNVQATTNIIEAAASRSGGTVPVIFASSAAIYGTPETIPIDETHPLAPLGEYGRAKLAGDEMVRARSDGPPACALRFFNIYGARQDPTSPYSGVLSIFTDRASADQPLSVHGDGLQTRDFVHVSDLVRAITAVLADLLDRGTSSALHAAAFNVATGVRTSLIDVLGAIESRLGRPVKRTHAPGRDGDIKHSVGDASALAAAIGWTATTPLAEGLADLLE